MKYILLVDDEPINIEIMEVILTDDYEIQSAENGVECLKSIDKRVPDLLLLDIAMPEMDGIEVCKALRSNEKTKKLPIIIVSGFDIINFIFREYPHITIAVFIPAFLPTSIPYSLFVI